MAVSCLLIDVQRIFFYHFIINRTEYNNVWHFVSLPFFSLIPGTLKKNEKQTSTSKLIKVLQTGPQMSPTQT